MENTCEKHVKNKNIRWSGNYSERFSEPVIIQNILNPLENKTNGKTKPKEKHRKMSI